jgi:hypothetical protein
VEELERDRDALIEFYAGAVPEALDRLDGEERNSVYRMLRLEITPRPDGVLDVRGILNDSLRLRCDYDSAAGDFVLTERHLSLGRPVIPDPGEGDWIAWGPTRCGSNLPDSV